MWHFSYRPKASNYKVLHFISSFDREKRKTTNCREHLSSESTEMSPKRILELRLRMKQFFGFKRKNRESSACRWEFFLYVEFTFLVLVRSQIHA